MSDTDCWLDSCHTERDQAELMLGIYREMLDDARERKRKADRDERWALVAIKNWGKKVLALRGQR